MGYRVDETFQGGPSVDLIEERVRAAYGPQDAERSAYLSHLIKVGGKCRYCGAEVADATLVRTPGVCARRACRREAYAAAGYPVASPTPKVLAFVGRLAVPVPDPRSAYGVQQGFKVRRHPFPEGVFGARRPPRYRWVWDDGDILTGWYTDNAETWVRKGEVVAVTSHPEAITSKARSILARIARDLAVTVRVQPGGSWAVPGAALVEVRAAG
jgi:hypothetical protein